MATKATTRHRERAASARSSIFSIPLSGIRSNCSANGPNKTLLRESSEYPSQSALELRP